MVVTDVVGAALQQRERGGNAQRAAIPGTGLGLSISRSVANAHGGTLTAESEPDGACFRLTLPRAVEDAAEAVPADTAQPAGSSAVSVTNSASAPS